MMLEKHFDSYRLGLLIKLYLYSSWKVIALTVSILFGFHFVVGFLLDMYVSDSISVYSHVENYISAMIFGGVILTSLSIRFFGHDLRRYQFLTLPASTLEKVLCVWLLTTVGWVVLFTMLYICYAWGLNIIGAWLFPSVSFETFEVFSSSNWLAIRYYMVVQSVFMLGAVYFKSYALPKTVLSLLVFAILFGVCAVLVMKETFMSEHYCEGGTCELFDEVWKNPVWSLLMMLFWWILAPLSWFFSFFGLMEEEV